MSSSSPSTARPANATLEKALQHAVRQVYKSGNLEDLTVRRVRKTVEEDLGLDEDFLKTDAIWSSKSKLIIQAEVDEHAEAEANSPLPTPKKPRTNPPKARDQHRKAPSAKRASTEQVGPRKRRKTKDQEEEDATSEEEAPKHRRVSKPKVKRQSRKKDYPDSGSTASGAEDDSAESSLGENCVDEDIYGNGTRKPNARLESPESYTEDDEGEEEEDVKPAKSMRNGAKRREGNSTRVEKKTPTKEKAPKRPTPKAKAVKHETSASVSSATEEEEVMPEVHDRKPTSNDPNQQPRSGSEMSELIDESPKPKRSRKPKIAEPKTQKPKPAKPTESLTAPEDAEPANAEQSDSSMSILIDEPPKPKRSRKPSSHPPKPKPSKSTKPAPATPSSPSTEEIKRLQSQLVKCGIRKMWPKYLAPYPTPKAKISHLKGMLADVGMVGRFSEARAEQIREERELRADLEAVLEGERKWGMGEEEGEDDGGGEVGRPKRRLARGLEGLGWMGDGDGEETD